MRLWFVGFSETFVVDTSSSRSVRICVWFKPCRGAHGTISRLGYFVVLRSTIVTVIAGIFGKCCW